MTSATYWRKALITVVSETTTIYLELLKVMLPALIVVKCLQELGAVEVIGGWMSPLMLALGLPVALGVVWATTLLTNLMTGMVVFFEVSQGLTLSVEQVTVLAVLMIIGHSLPVEGAVAKRAGVPWWVTIALRVGGGIVLAALVHGVYSWFDLYQQPASVIWQATDIPDTLPGWVLSQVKSLAMIFIVILILVSSLKLLRKLGIERLLHMALVPVLRMLGIGKSAANVTVIGVALGLSYGAGLLIRDVDKGVMSRRDSFLALCFLGLFHSIIEDTLLLMTLGASLSGILLARTVFAIAVIAALSRITPDGNETPDKLCTE